MTFYCELLDPFQKPPHAFSAKVNTIVKFEGLIEKLEGSIK
jgi:hypothetical protein